MTYPQPPDEIPTEGTTVFFRQPDDEIPTEFPRIHTDSHAAAYSCSENGKYYHEGQKWQSSPCTNCSCVNHQILCKRDPTCSTGILCYYIKRL